MKYCTYCGKELLDEAVICPGCGCACVDNKAKMMVNTKNSTLDAKTIIWKIVGGVKASAILWLITGVLQIILGFAYIFLGSSWWSDGLIPLACGVFNLIFSIKKLGYAGKIRTNFAGITEEAKFSKVIGMYIYNGIIILLAAWNKSWIELIIFGGLAVSAIIVDGVAYRGVVKQNYEALLELERSQEWERYPGKGNASQN